MKSKKRMLDVVLAILILVVIVIVLFPVQTPKSDTIRIGVLLPLSDSAASYGEKSQRGIEIAREEMAKDSPDLDIQVFYEDSYYTPKGGVDAYRKLKSANGIDAVITGASQVALAVLPLSTEDGVLQMAIFASNEKYTVPDDLSFRVSNRNKLEAEALAGFIKEKGFSRLGIIYLNNEFGVGFKDSLKDQLVKKQADAEIVSEEGYALEDADFRTQLLKIKQLDSDIIFMVGVANHYALILKQARELRMATQFLSMRSAEDPVLIEVAGENAEGLIYSYPFDATSENTAVSRFANSFRAKYNATPDAYAAEGYEAFKLVAQAFAACGKDNECIKGYFTGLKDYRSLFGNLSFDQNGDVHYGFFLKTVKNGQFVPYGE